MEAITQSRRKGMKPGVVLQADKRFGRFAKEPDMIERRLAQVVETQGLRQIIRVWELFSELILPEDGLQVMVKKALLSVQTLAYHKQDITSFSLALEEFQGVKLFGIKVGIFLSALINLSEEDVRPIEIYLQHLTERIHGLGFENTKEIVVHGCLGGLIGLGMRKGKIEITEDVDSIMNFHGGLIIVRGNVNFVDADGGEVRVGGSIVHLAKNSKPFVSIIVKS